MTPDLLGIMCARLSARSCPYSADMLADVTTYNAFLEAVERGDVVGTVLGCDPGTQTGWALVARVHRTRADGVSEIYTIPLMALVHGRRSVIASRGMPMSVARPPTFCDHDVLVRSVCDVLDGEAPQPIVVAEDYFVGPNPATVRDVSRQFHFVEAVAEMRGLKFRAVAHSTWKKAYIGRGNMRSEDALVAYAAAGFAAHPTVSRWAGTRAADLKLADDAAALGVATYYAGTESKGAI